jgi:hypothetical protein
VEKTKTALGIFELPRRDPEIEKRAPDRANSQFVENFVCVPKIRLHYADTPAETRQLSTHMMDSIRILIQRKNVGPGP